MKILFVAIITLMSFSVQSQVPKLKNKDIWKSLYPTAQKFDSKGRLIRVKATRDLGRPSKTNLAHIFYYKKNNLNKAAVVLFTFEYYSEKEAMDQEKAGDRVDGHASRAVVSIATFTLLSNNKWTKTKFVENWQIPQQGYGIDPPLQLKNYKNTTCLYLKCDNTDNNIEEENEPPFYECYFDIESFNEIRWIKGQKITIDQFGNEKKESEKVKEPNIKIAAVKKINNSGMILNRKYVNTQNNSSLTFLENGKAIMKKADGSNIGNNSIYYTYTVIKNKLTLVLHVPVQNQSTLKVIDSKVKIEYTIGSNRIYNDKEIRILELITKTAKTDAKLAKPKSKLESKAIDNNLDNKEQIIHKLVDDIPSRRIIKYVKTNENTKIARNHKTIGNFEIEEKKRIIGNPIIIGNLEIAQHDFPTQKTWNGAKSACAALGDGWHLPTEDELKLMYLNRDKIGGFSSENPTWWYWSSSSENLQIYNSTEYSQNPIVIEFIDGKALYPDEYTLLSVRAVRKY